MLLFWFVLVLQGHHQTAAVTVVAFVSCSMGFDTAAFGSCLPIVVLLGMLLMETIFVIMYLSGAAVLGGEA